jgi:DNA polymerase I-like protein with 3'-5' exonuclease and polymerase domains
MRQYCRPDDGFIWLKRDFSSQEIRILAHFEDGSLCEAYRSTPDLDPHQMAREIIHALTGVMYARADIKITGFSIIYGTGNRGLAVQLVQPLESAAAIKSAYLTAMPAVRHLMDDVQRRGRSGEPIKTWGGRLYYSEAPGFSKKYNRMMTYEYKLLNYLIQGSAADQTKESIVDWNEHRSWEAQFLATVHDENNIQAPAEDYERHMAILKTCMERDRFDVPMLSEGFKGLNWHQLVKCT